MSTPLVWIFCSLLGVILLILSASRITPVIDDLAGILAWIFLFVSAVQSFAIDTVTGSGASVQGTMYVLLENHTIYHYDLLGVVLIIVWVISCANLYRLWLDYRRIVQQEKAEAEQKARQPPKQDQGKGPAPDSMNTPDNKIR